MRYNRGVSRRPGGRRSARCGREESPSSTGRGCPLTAGRSDPTESATETDRRFEGCVSWGGKGEKAR